MTRNQWALLIVMAFFFLLGVALGRIQERRSIRLVERFRDEYRLDEAHREIEKLHALERIHQLHTVGS